MGKSKLYTRTLTLPNGRRKYFRGVTEEEAERKLNEARYKMGMGLKIDDNTTFGELAELWYNVYKKPRLKSPNSRAEVLNILNNHILPYLTSYLPSEITPAHVQIVLNPLEETSKTLYRKTLQTLRSIFTIAIDSNLILKSPLSDRVKAGGKATEEKKPLTTEQARRLLDAVRGTNVQTFIVIGLNAGLRRGEILGLMWDDIDLKAGEITVQHNAVFDPSKNGEVTVTDTTKTPAGKRVVPMPPPLTAYLRRQKLASRSEYVVPMKDGNPMTKSAFRAMWKLVEMRTISQERDPETGEMRMQELGSHPKKHPNVVRTLDFHVTPHLLRHTYITRLFDAGLDIKEVQYLAGHKTPDVTLKIYTHYLTEQRHGETAAKIRDKAGPFVSAFVSTGG